MSNTLFDFKRKFLIAQLSNALPFFTFLQTNKFVSRDALYETMLGTARDDTGNYQADATKVTWCGDKGAAAFTYTDPVSKQLVSVPAKGDPLYYYIWLRSEAFSLSDLTAAGYTDAQYGFVIPTDAEIMQVLGTWS